MRVEMAVNVSQAEERVDLAMRGLAESCQVQCGLVPPASRGEIAVSGVTVPGGGGCTRFKLGVVDAVGQLDGPGSVCQARLGSATLVLSLRQQDQCIRLAGGRLDSREDVRGLPQQHICLDDLVQREVRLAGLEQRRPDRVWNVQLESLLP